MGSRYEVNKFIKAAHNHGKDYEIVPSSLKFSFANSETTPVHQALQIWFWFPSKPPMFTIVDIVEQGRVSKIAFTAASEETTDAVGYAS